MNLRKKKELAARALNISRSRILFISSRMDEIKEAITKQDIKDLYQSGAIRIREINGRRKNEKRKHKKGRGNVRKHVRNSKREYIILTRKLRRYIQELKNQGKLSSKEIENLRKKIKNRHFQSKSHLKDYLNELTR